MKARALHKLTVRSIAAHKTPGRYSDGGCLYLIVSQSGAKTWAFMFMRQGRQREAGLGSLRVVTLAEARQKAQECRLLLAKGVDPIDARKIANRHEGVKTFGQCIKELVKSKRAGWRSVKHAKCYADTLTIGCAPIAHLPVAEIDTPAVLKVIQPLWLKTPVSAERLLNRIAAVLDYARANGWRAGENPARWKGHLENILSKHSRIQPHLAAMPFDSLPTFLQELHTQSSMQA